MGFQMIYSYQYQGQEFNKGGLLFYYGIASFVMLTTETILSIKGRVSTCFPKLVVISLFTPQFIADGNTLDNIFFPALAKIPNMFQFLQYYGRGGNKIKTTINRTTPNQLENKNRIDLNIKNQDIEISPPQKVIITNQPNPKEIKDINHTKIVDSQTQSVQTIIHETINGSSSSQSSEKLHINNGTSTKALGMPIMGRSNQTSQLKPTTIRHYPHQAIPIVLSSIGHSSAPIRLPQIES